MTFSNAATVFATAAKIPFIAASSGYFKEIAKVKRYVKGEDVYNITPELLKHWVDTFAAMRVANVKVPVQIGHEDGAEGVGWIKSLHIDGTKLIAGLTLAGSAERGTELVEANDVSLFARTFTDGLGKEWNFPISHLALTPTPLFPDLGEFQQIAASRVPVFQAAVEEENKEEPKKEDEEVTLESLDKRMSAVENVVDELVKGMPAKVEAAMKQAAIVASRTGSKTGPQGHVVKSGLNGGAGPVLDYVNKTYPGKK